MIPLPAILITILALTSRLRYLLLFVGALIEGPVLMITSGFLVRYHLLAIIPVFIALVAGDLVGDIAWYYAGYYFAQPLIQNHGTFIGVTPDVFEKIKNLFSKYHEKILLASKLTLGFGMAVGILMTAGATHIPFKKYMILNFIGELFFVTTLLLLGYFFGEIYNRIAQDFKIVFIIVIAISISAVLYGVSKYLRQKTLAL